MLSPEPAGHGGQRVPVAPEPPGRPLHQGLCGSSSQDLDPKELSGT